MRDLFASPLLQKIAISSIQCRNFKYTYGQETVLFIQNPVMPDDEKLLSSQRVSTELIWSTKGEREFSTENSLQAVKLERSDVRKTQDNISNDKLEGIVKNLDILDHCILLLAKQKGSWLTVWGTAVTNKVLLAIKFSAFLCPHHNVTPLT